MTVELLFPVIAWYDIIGFPYADIMSGLLFPVIAWYDIIEILGHYDVEMLLFPVIAWYDIMLKAAGYTTYSCCSQLSLGMI